MTRMSNVRRAKLQKIAGVKGAPDSRCMNQKITDIGTWPSGRTMQEVTYLHPTKGFRCRRLAPLQPKWFFKFK